MLLSSVLAVRFLFVKFAAFVFVFDSLPKTNFLLFVHGQFRENFFLGQSKTVNKSALGAAPAALNKRFLFEGDIAVSNENPLELIQRLMNQSAALASGEISADNTENENSASLEFAAVRSENKKWPSRTVPYKMHASVTSALRERIANVTKYVMDNVCVQIVPFNEQKHKFYFEWFQVPVVTCHATIGRSTTPSQPSFIALHPSCSDGNIIHELFHLLGFYHEQARTDRDSFVTIEYENIDPQETRQFLKYNEDELDELGFEYDYGSIMHYQQNAFAISDNLITIKPNRPVEVEIGQRRAMSPLDMKKMHRFFLCPLKCNNEGDANITCVDQSACYKASQHCDGQRQCQDGSDEKDCRPTCSQSEFLCENKNIGAGHCIPRTSLCDGQIDCQDGTDERTDNCPPSCDIGYYQCESDSTRCLPNWRRCDGTPDCPDGDDERDCKAAKFTAPPIKLPTTPPVAATPSHSSSKNIPAVAPAAAAALTPKALESAADPCSNAAQYYSAQYYNYCYYNYRARQLAQQYGTNQIYNALSAGGAGFGGFGGSTLGFDPIDTNSDSQTINTVCGLPQSFILKARAGMVRLNMTFLIEEELCDNLLVLSAAIRPRRSSSNDDGYGTVNSDDDDDKVIKPEIFLPDYTRNFIRTTLAEAQARKQRQLREQQYSSRRMEVYVAIDVGTNVAAARMLSDMVRYSGNVPKSKESVNANSRLDEFAESVRTFARNLSVDGVVFDWRNTRRSALVTPQVILNVLKQLEQAFRRDPAKGPEKIDLFLGIILSPSILDLIRQEEKNSPTLLRDIVHVADFVLYANDEYSSPSSSTTIMEPLNKLFTNTVMQNNAFDLADTKNVTQKFFITLTTGGKSYLLYKNQTTEKNLKFGSTEMAGTGGGSGQVSSDAALLSFGEVCKLLNVGKTAAAAKRRKFSSRRHKIQHRTNNSAAKQYIQTTLAAAAAAAAAGSIAGNLTELMAFRPARDMIVYENSCSFAQKIALFKQHNSVQGNEQKKLQRRFAGIFIDNIMLDDSLGECYHNSNNNKDNSFPLLQTLATYLFVEQTAQTCSLAKDYV